MANILQRLQDKKLITPPSWLVTNTMYLTEMGSVAYGCSSDDSDIDIYGFCIPRKDTIFPHLAGEIPGFGNQIQRFDQYQQHHILDQDAKKEYDVTVYSIVKYFQLCMENNPNMIDSLFTPVRCVRHTTDIGNLVRENRDLFLHKGSFHNLRGYAFAQLHKAENKVPIGKRVATIEEHGVDVKFLYHVVRLTLEAEQILTTHTLVLDRDREILKSIRRGEWTLEQTKEWFTTKERSLEELYASSTLRHNPDEGAIKNLLLKCLEEHYGDLSTAVITETQAERAINEIRMVMDKYHL